MAAINAILITCCGSRVVADASKNCTLKGKKPSRPPKTKKTKSMCRVVRQSSPPRFPHAAGYR
jgi:hypothetical protein